MREYSALNYQVLESMADWVRVVDYEGNILYANKSMKDSVGNDIIGMKCYRAYGKLNLVDFVFLEEALKLEKLYKKKKL